MMVIDQNIDEIHGLPSPGRSVNRTLFTKIFWAGLKKNSNLKSL